MTIDHHYQCLLKDLLRYGKSLITRNHAVRSLVATDCWHIQRTPLIVTRKTAWKKALREMQWFMSGQSECPHELLDWWDGQLNPLGHYSGGYAEQFRKSGAHQFDQVGALLDGLLGHPHSRRHVLTSWEPWTMSRIAMLNQNKDTPSCCHTSFNQYFVRDGVLHGTTYQRSADVLLGLPHNLCQQFALLHYFAHHSQLEVGSLRYIVGDAHLYDHSDHLACAEAIIEAPVPVHSLNFLYRPSYTSADTPPFLAEDFSIEGEIPEPVVKIRPPLL